MAAELFKQLTEKSPWIPHSFNDVTEVYFISPQEIVCLNFNSIPKQQVKDREGCINKATDQKEVLYETKQIQGMTPPSPQTHRKPASTTAHPPNLEFFKHLITEFMNLLYDKLEWQKGHHQRIFKY